MKKNFFTLNFYFAFETTLPLAKLDILSLKLVSSDLILQDDNPVDIQLVTLFLRSNINELRLEAKTKNSDNHCHL